MSLSITGKVYKVLQEVSGEGRNGEWRKRDFVIETEGQYPKKICFTSWGDLSDGVKGLEEGQTVEVHFEVESREWNDKWFTDAKCWKFDVKSTDSEGQPNEAPPPVSEYDPPEEDELPF